ncbi:OmpA family protein [Flavobacterium ginsengiterrae]|uniref:OmpA-like domain-containing protein n=1 Tax=Flavobacterium ginsengiterrae TaxID=871695 RepID=A0ABP7GF90_9FLAO
MAKGIKKIEWTGEGKIVSSLSVPDQRTVIQADQFVYFKISEWYNDTNPDDKKRNVLWHFQTNNPRESVLKTTKKGEDTYGIKLPKNLCGPFLYYLQVNLPSLEYSKSAGLLISGWCEPRIISSAWATETKGTDVRLSHYFCYGHPVYLHLKTEGLNGCNNLIIEVHRRVKGGQKVEDDELIKVYTKVPVINGEINVILNDTSNWNIKHKNEIEDFYIKVKNPEAKEYIKDYNNDVYHARYLRIKNKTEFILPKIDTGNNKAKVGKSKKYEKNPGSCKFAKIRIGYNEDDDLIFDEGKFIRRANPDDKFDILEKIHYDFDKWEIRNDAKPILDKVAVYLKEPPLLPVELGAHTDNRGTDEYNLELSVKRADSVVKYLISQGVDKNLISAKGYGKTKLIHQGENISEELHQENRRTTLRFKLFENDAQTLVHDLIVPSYKKPGDIKISIEDFSRKACHKTKDHTNQLISRDSYNKKESHDLIEKKGANNVNVKLHSRTPTTPKISDSLSFGKTYKNIYHYYLNSCAYYSLNTNPTLAINAYPDIVWIGHFQYNYTHHEDQHEPAKAPYYFHNKKLELKNGIKEEINEISNSLIDKILAFFPAYWLTEKIFLGYVRGSALIYDVGLHAIYDRELEKREQPLNLKGTELDFIKTDSTTRRIAALIIYEMVAVGIIIDLLMIYLTEGGSAKGKILKITSKANEVSKYVKEVGAKLVPSSIAINTGMYYKLMQDRRMALILEANIKADPLVAINFERKFNLKSLLYDEGHKHETNKDKKEANEAISEILAKIGNNDVTFTLTIVGEINLEQNVLYNVLTEQYSLKDKFSELVQNNTTAYSKRIKGTVSFETDLERELFKFTPIETKVTAHIKLDLACEAILITKFGYDKKGGQGLFMEKKMKFSGLKGTFQANGRVKPKNKKPIGYSANEGKPIDFTVLEGHTISLGIIYLFNNTKPQ